MRSNEKKTNSTALGRIIGLASAVTLLVLSLTGCEGAGAGTQMGAVGYIIYFVGIAAMVYLLLIRPERKRKKQTEKMRNSVEVGNYITTIGGIYGRVVHVSEKFITFETSEDRVRIQVTRWAISSVGKGPGEETVDSAVPEEDKKSK